MTTYTLPNVIAERLKAAGLPAQVTDPCLAYCDGSVEIDLGVEVQVATDGSYLVVSRFTEPVPYDPAKVTFEHMPSRSFDDIDGVVADVRELLEKAAAGDALTV